MKNILYKIVLINILFVISITALSQNDTTFQKLEKKQCKLFRTFDKETTLIKIGLTDINLSHNAEQNSTYFRMYVDIGIEQKIIDNLSVNIEYKPAITYSKSDFYRNYGLDTEKKETYEYSSFFKAYKASIGLKYYYNLRWRMKKGKSGNNFSGNYFTFEYLSGDFALGYGIQRRLGKYGYADIYLGPVFVKRIGNDYHLSLGIFNYSIGLAF